MSYAIFVSYTRLKVSIYGLGQDSEQLPRVFSYNKPYLCEYQSKLDKTHMYSDYIEHGEHNESIFKCIWALLHWEIVKFVMSWNSDFCYPEKKQ